MTNRENTRENTNEKGTISDERLDTPTNNKTHPDELAALREAVARHDARIDLLRKKVILLYQQVDRLCELMSRSKG